ncbi:MAG: DEAD/DEAH box helicase [Candidatus Woesearchaeota archaeon]
MQFKSFTLDRFQEEAARAIEKNQSVVVSAPTGSGKTLIADYVIMLEEHKHQKIVYTAPIKALSNQKYKDFCHDYGESNVGLLTGDLVINPDARVLVMTTEIYRNMVMVKDPIVDEIAYVVFDEIHYINDIERGYIWEESVIFSPETVRFLCLSATIPNAKEFAGWIRSIKQHEVAVVKHTERPVPLRKLFYDEDLGITELDRIQKVQPEKKARGYFKQKAGETGPNPFRVIRLLREHNDIPALFFVFSRAETQKLAEMLGRREDFLTREESREVTLAISKAFGQLPEDVKKLKSAQLLRRLLGRGIGFHHAGLLPALKNLVESLFSTGMIKILFTTETFAVGINYPARTVVFKSLRKFDGHSFRYVNSKEYFQIAGRAGRRGMDKEGKAIAMIDPRTDDLKQIAKFTFEDTEPLQSQFRLSYNTVLNMIRGHNEEQIDTILVSNFFCYQKAQTGMTEGQARGVMRRRWTNLTKVLQKYKYIQGDSITEKGEFASYMFADELEFTEIFGTQFHKGLTTYQTLMIVAALCYEKRPRTKFFNKQGGHDIKDLLKRIEQNEPLRQERRFNNIHDLTSIILPLSKGVPFLEILANTNMLEGDLIRIFRQMMDRIMTVRKATRDDELQNRLDKSVKAIDECFKDIGLI